MPDDDPVDPLDKTLLVETVLRAPDLGYAALYSRAGEFVIFAVPTILIVSALVGALVYFAPSGSRERTLSAMGAVLLVGTWVKWIVAIGILLYPTYKVWKAAIHPAGKATHHLFTKEGIEMVGAENTSL